MRQLSRLFKKTLSRLLGPRYIARRALKAELASGEPEIRLLPALADPSGVFVDVGANNGSYSLYAIPHFAKVLAVEAHPKLADWLKVALRPNGEVLHAALSDKKGVATLHVPVLGENAIMTRCSLNEDANPGFSLSRVEVPMTSLDALELNNVRVVKIDVEGHELDVLKGARETIKRCRPVCIVECEERHNAGGIARAFTFFEQLGYEAWFIHRRALRAGSEFNPSVLQRAADAKTVSGGRSPDYINNFIFVPTGNRAILDRMRTAMAQ